MINTDMRLYDYSTLGSKNEYGQTINDNKVVGQIKIAINLNTQSIQDNIMYREAQYIGFTFDKDVNDKYIIHFGDEKLKVLYVNPFGRLKQVFMKAI